MPQDPAPHTDLRKAGLAAALVVGLLLAAGLAVVALTRRPSVPPGVPGAQPSGHTPEVAPDVTQRGIQTGTARVQFADKKDPGRAAGMIEWTSLDPISPTEKLLTEPRGYVYLRDGGLVVVASKSGKLNTTPKIEEPQSGRFEGNVTLKLFPAGTDPKADAPTLTATSDSLDFDFPSASMSTTGPFTVRSTGFDIDGSGMRLIVNQVEEGIERFEVAHIRQVVIRPDARDPLGTKGFTGTQTARATPGAARGPDHLRIYRAVFDTAVKITQAGRSMTADRAEVWTHLLNNRLVPGAIGRFGPDPVLTGSCPDTGEAANLVLDAVPDAPAKPAPPPPPTSPMDGPDTSVTATWGGKMVVTPVAEQGDGAIPTELSDNKVALRLHGEQNPVTVSDEAFHGVMKAARVDFGATTRILDLTASPAHKVQIDTESAGSLLSTAAKVNMGTGVITLTGPGELSPAKSALAKSGSLVKPGDKAPPATTLNFNQTLTLNFRTVGNFITSDARSANIKGGFTATSGEVKANADEATVVFGPRLHDRNAVQELQLNGNAVASAPAAVGSAPTPGVPARPVAPGMRDTLHGHRMTFKFEPDPATGEERPTEVEVSGNARATAGGTGDGALSLQARTITAKLGRDASGQIAVTRAQATDDVHIADNPGNNLPTLAASAEKLTVDPATGVAHLYGHPVTVSREGAVMTGEHLQLTQATGEVLIDTPGTVALMKDADPAKNDPGASAFASWQTSMRFNNTSGEALCVGDASATLTTGETERSVLQADTVRLQFTPAPKKGEKAAQRELLTAEAIGELGVDGKPPRPATLEHRMFSASNGVQKLDRLVYLEGFRINANQPARTLDVPVAGKLLVDDRSPDAAKAPPASADTPINPLGGFTSAKGTSLFTWTGSLHLSLLDGKAELKRDVALTHQPMPLPGQPAPAQTTLDCDTLTAILETKAAPAGAAAPSALNRLDATLKRVEASGNIVAKSDGKQLTASTITFDTLEQFIEAAGDANTNQPLVTFLDPSRPAPIRARKVTWNQKTGEVRIIEPAPTTIGN